jgi:crossover junction endodeoxyribonuclease RusA
MRVVTIRVLGVPQPKGSTRAFVPRSWAAQGVAAGTTPRAVVTADNPRSKGWEQLVRAQAQASADGTLFAGAVAVSMTFELLRPASLPRRVVDHCKAPDVDKLARAVLDGLTGVLFANDAAVIALDVRKVYAPPGRAPGATITVAETTAAEELATLFASEFERAQQTEASR